MKSYKIIRVAGLHYQKLKEELSKKISSMTYQEQQKYIFEKAYVYSDSFSKNMEKLHHHASEIIYDLSFHQKKWAEENSFNYTNSQWQRDILIAQLKYFKPEVVFFQDIHSLSYKDFVDLKKMVPSIRCLVMFRGYPGLTANELKTLSLADLLLVGSPKILQKTVQLGLNAKLIYHSFDSSILNKLKNGLEKKPFTFLGSSGYGCGISHLERYIFLQKLLEKTNIRLWIEESPFIGKKTLKDFIRSFLTFFFEKISLNHLPSLAKIIPFVRINKIINQIYEEKKIVLNSNLSYPLTPLSKFFSPRCHKPLFGIEMYQLFHDSSLTFNIHSCAAKGFVDNMRLFQATGCGSCLVTDTGENLPDLFEPDSEVVTYSTFEECREKIDFLLNNEKERIKIAKRGQQRVLNYHTAYHRVQEINQLLQEFL